MVRLYLLGFTHDLKGVVFSQRKGGKTATFWLPVDNTFRDALDKLDRARREAEQESRAAKAGRGKGTHKPIPARPSQDGELRQRQLPAVGRSVSSSRIPASEIQQLLREGRTVKSVVDVSKATKAWVERLQEPVMAERIGVIRLAQQATMSRPRLGRSGLPVGDAVRRNLEDRRATVDTIEGLDDAWDARATRSGQWRVSVRFSHRGKRRTAEWNFRKDTRQVTSRNRLAAQLGWWPPEPSAAPEPEPVDAAAAAGPEQEGEAKPRRRKPARRSGAKRKRKPTRRKSGARAAKSPSSRKATSKRPTSRRSAGQ